MCFATTYESTSKTTEGSPALAALRIPSFSPSYSATLFDARPIDALHHAYGSPLSPGLHTAVPYPALPTLWPCSRRLAPSDLYRTARPIGLGGRILFFLLSFFVVFVAHPVSHGQSSNFRMVNYGKNGRCESIKLSPSANRLDTNFYFYWSFLRLNCSCSAALNEKQVAKQKYCATI